MLLTIILCSCGFHTGDKGCLVAFEEACLALAKLNADGLGHHIDGDYRHLLKQCAEDGHVCALGVANGLCNAHSVAVDDGDIVTGGLALDDGAVDDENAAGLNALLELVKGLLENRSYILQCLNRQC